jgi:hypothetical protein
VPVMQVGWELYMPICPEPNEYEDLFVLRALFPFQLSKSFCYSLASDGCYLLLHPWESLSGIGLSCCPCGFFGNGVGLDKI